MCVGDWRLGRLIRHKSTLINTTGPVNTTFLPNEQRVGFALGSNVSLDAVTSVAVITFDDGSILNWKTNQASRVFSIREYCHLICRGFTITSVGTAFSGSVVEYYLPEDVLQAAMASFKSEYKY